MPKKKNLTATHHAVVLTCTSFLYTDIFVHHFLVQICTKKYTKKRRNKQKHFNVTVANQFTVHRTSYCKENFSFNKSERGETPIASGVLPSQHFTVIKKYGRPCCSTKKGQSSKSNFDNNAKQFWKKNWMHLISMSRLNVQSKIKISGGSFYNRPKPFSGLT